MSKATERPDYLKRYIPTVKDILEETKQDRTKPLTVKDRYGRGLQDGLASSYDQSDWSDHKRKDDPYYFNGYLAGLSAGKEENKERGKEYEYV